MTSDRDRERARSVAMAIRDRLEDRRCEIVAEIRHYPPPIPACDVQFNRLIEDRDRISREIGRIDALLGGRTPRAGRAKAIDAFIAASPDIDPDLKRKLRSELAGSP